MKGYDMKHTETVASSLRQRREAAWSRMMFAHMNYLAEPTSQPLKDARNLMRQEYADIQRICKDKGVM